MDSTALLITLPASTSTDTAANESWDRWTQKGRDHDQLMLERWRVLAAAVIAIALLTVATVLALR